MQIERVQPTPYTPQVCSGYDGRVARTNIDIDDRLVAIVMQRYSLRTKREAVDLALRRLVGEPPATEEILQLEGSGWEADLDEIRVPRVEPAL